MPVQCSQAAALLLCTFNASAVAINAHSPIYTESLVHTAKKRGGLTPAVAPASAATPGSISGELRGSGGASGKRRKRSGHSLFQVSYSVAYV